MNRFTRVLSHCLLLSGLLAASAFAASVTYQGQLQSNGAPFNGTANLEFRLFDSLAAGTQIGPGQTFISHPVDAGLFQVELTFDAGSFSAGERFLEVWVNGAPLSPRQAVNATPLALHALNVPETASPFSLDALSGTVSHASASQAIRFEPRDASEPQLDSPSIAFGVPENLASAAGAVVLGGGSSVGPNLAAGEHSAIVGGIGNQADGFRSFIGGGSSNRASTILAAVVGGLQNHATGTNSFVGGGQTNNASGSRSTIPGGWLNCAGGRQSWAGGTRAAVRQGSSTGNELAGCADVPFTSSGDGDVGTFVWADSQGDRFISSGMNQFLVRSSGGALITANSAVNSPEGNRLRVNGTLRVDTLGSAGATALCHNASNQLASCSSSARYKRDIEALAADPDLIDQLRPVRYHWIDGGQPDIGFVAEEVAELMPELITRNEQGDIEGVRYDRLSAVLVAAMQAQRAENDRVRGELVQLAEHQRVFDDLAARNAELESRLASLEDMLLGRRLSDTQTIGSIDAGAETEAGVQRQ